MVRYFFMDEDNALGDVIQFRDFDLYGPREIFTWENRERVKEHTTLYLASDGGECAPDFIKSPMYMVSLMARKVIEMYEDEVAFKKIVFINKEKEEQMLYYHLLLKEIEALHSNTVYYPNGMEKHIVLNKKKIGNRKAFLLSDSQKKNPVISQDIVESLLRRHVLGIRFKEVEVI